MGSSASKGGNSETLPELPKHTLGKYAKMSHCT